MKQSRINLRIEKELMKKIEKLLKGQSLSDWIREAIEAKLKNNET